MNPHGPGTGQPHPTPIASRMRRDAASMPANPPAARRAGGGPGETSVKPDPAAGQRGLHPETVH